MSFYSLFTFLSFDSESFVEPSLILYIVKIIRYKTLFCNDKSNNINVINNIGGEFMIDILERITYYRKQKNWSEYQLAERAGLTQSTISSWYRRNLVPSIPSLEKICNAFGITLSQFFSTEDNSFALTDTQKELLKGAGHLTDVQQLALIEFFKTL